MSLRKVSLKAVIPHNKRPVELMPVEEFRDLVEAISMEKQIKGWSRQKKKALIADNYQKLVELVL
jgi:putative endonuclease